MQNSELWQRAWDKISEIEDPELGFSITEMGLIYELAIEEGKASVRMTFTSMACPVGPQIVGMVESALRTVEGIAEASVEVVFSPPWNPHEMASEEIQSMMGLI